MRASGEISILGMERLQVPVPIGTQRLPNVFIFSSSGECRDNFRSLRGLFLVCVYFNASGEPTCQQTHFWSVCSTTSSYVSTGPSLVCLCLFQYQWSYISTDPFLVCLCLFQYPELRFDRPISGLCLFQYKLHLDRPIYDLCLFRYRELQFSRPISGLFVFVSIPVELHFNRPISGLFVFVSIPVELHFNRPISGLFVFVTVPGATFQQPHSDSRVLDIHSGNGEQSLLCALNIQRQIMTLLLLL